MSTPFIVAEIGAAHNGSPRRALETVRAAKEAGADGVKFQYWTPGTMCLDRDYVIKTGAWAGHNLAQLYDRAQTPAEWLPYLFDFAREIGLTPSCSPFDAAALDLLQSPDINCGKYKIASFELLDIELIMAVARTGKPIAISVGMATDQEIAEAVSAVMTVNHHADLTLLQCTSAYPAPLEQSNLLAIRTMADLFRCKTGLSDHSGSNMAPAIATALGATMIEAHICLDRNEGGLDDAFAMTPGDFKRMVAVVRETTDILGTGGLGRRPAESTELRRGLYWTRDLPAGHIITEADMTTARPSTMTSPAEMWSLCGHRLALPVRAGTPLDRGEFERPL